MTKTSIHLLYYYLFLPPSNILTNQLTIQSLYLLFLKLMILRQLTAHCKLLAKSWAYVVYYYHKFESL